jgi:hypothetical protein
MALPRVSLLVVSGLLALLAGCAAPTRLDASSYDKLQASMTAAEHQLFAKDKPVFAADRKRFMAIYFAKGKATPAPAGYPDWAVVDGMTASEFHAYLRDLSASKHTTLRPADDFPNPAFNVRLLAQYRMERELSDLARNAILDDGKNTLDQYPIEGAFLVPPPAEGPLSQDKARFVVTMRNRSGFDAYKPTFRVRVTSASLDAALLDREFDLVDRQEPIAPGAVETIELTCCDISSDPFNNRLLRTLPADAQISIELTGVKDHANSPILVTTGYDQQSLRRRAIADRCIAVLSANLRTWVPPKAGDPDECGSPASAADAKALVIAPAVAPRPSTPTAQPAGWTRVPSAAN